MAKCLIFLAPFKTLKLNNLREGMGLFESQRVSLNPLTCRVFLLY
jgi:hypothetical protein